MVQCFGIVGFDGQGAREARHRLVKAPHVLQQDAAIGPGPGIAVGLDRQRLVITRQGLVKAAQAVQRIAAIVQRLGKAGIDRQRLVETGQGLLRPITLRQQHAAIVERIGNASAGPPAGGLKAGQRRVRPPQAVQQKRTLIQGGGEIRTQPRRMLIVGQRLFETAEIGQQDGAVVRRRGQSPAAAPRPGRSSPALPGSAPAVSGHCRN